MQNSSWGKELNKFFSPNRSDDLFFCLYPSSTVCVWSSPAVEAEKDSVSGGDGRLLGLAQLGQVDQRLQRGQVELHHPAQKKDKYRRKDKGRRCCLGDRIASIPCRVSYCALGRFWRIGWIHPFLQIILLHFILFFQCETASAARNWINSAPLTEESTITFYFVFILLLWYYTVDGIGPVDWYKICTD